ncbi:alpha-ketoacid dehydrogenase subunit beta [Paenibacillus spongiae]|uniref:Alpha-ketoacid dehydrogenase subunit beta n=1 Tax=Paenibacillus spongiae TaxID=2909671 RepID=A0ABY5SGA3_9BACL|nr:alpha-ketoacid dehydrogenase subunit beta [Paenibacillus spongiae]UVI32971.1 alpha-ketoacid dehydrogenase subunit beta [Paenibacillus spongiae]
MRELTYASAYAEAIREEMERDPNIFVLGTDIRIRGGHFGQLKDIGKTFGHKRVVDTPISEAAMVGMSLGAALTGLRPICDLNFEDFYLGAMDEVVNQIAKVQYKFNGQFKCPVIIRASSGAARSTGPQHSQSFEAWFAHTPGLYVAMPSTPEDIKGLMKTALRGSNPVIFSTHKMLSSLKGHVPEHDYAIPFGQAKIVKPGSDVTIATYSIMVSKSLQAAAVLEKQGISAEVIDLRTIAPLDLDRIAQSVRKTKRLVIAHEAYRHGGIGAEIAASIGETVFDYLDAPIMRVGSKHSVMPVSPILQDAITPNQNDVIAAVNSVMEGVKV